MNPADRRKIEEIIYNRLYANIVSPRDLEDLEQLLRAIPENEKDEDFQNFLYYKLDKPLLELLQTAQKVEIIQLLQQYLPQAISPHSNSANNEEDMQEWAYIDTNQIAKKIRQEQSNLLHGKIFPLEILPHKETEGTTNGWVIKNENSEKDEINIFFMGTAGAPLFGGHTDIYEGGDVLCNLAMQKALEENKQVMLIRGVGTAKMSPNQPLEYLENPFSKAEDSLEMVSDLSIKKGKTEGGAAGNILGSGLEKRISVAMEKYYIPQLIEMIQANQHEIKVNITGHSRGAITTFAMADCIDKWTHSLTELNDEAIQALGSQINQQNDQMEVEQIVLALKKLKEGKININMRLVAYDPVEGRTGLGNIKTSKLAANWTADFDLPIYGQNIKFSYSKMPKSVKDLKVILAHAEYREAFQPTIPTLDENTNTEFSVVIGGHGTMKGNLSDHSNTGQDSYPIAKEQKFIREAGRASIDLGRVDVIPSLFQQYPPFLSVTLFNIFSANDAQGYIRTKNRLIKTIPDYDYNKYNSIFQKINQRMDLSAQEWEEVDSLFQQCKQAMRQDQDLCKQLYFDLTRDVHEIYLNPKDDEKLMLLGRWFHEMKNDTTDAGIKLLKTDPTLPRKIWHRNEHEQMGLEPLTRTFPASKYEPASLMFYPNNCQVGGVYQTDDGFINQQYTNPYLFNLENIFTDEEKATLTLEQLSNLEKLALDFNTLNKIGLKFNTKQTEERYSHHANRFIDQVTSSNLPEHMKIAMLGTLSMKDKYQYKKGSSFEFDKTVADYCAEYQINKMYDLLMYYPTQPGATSKQYREIIKSAKKLCSQLENYNSAKLRTCQKLCSNESTKQYIQLDRQIQKYKKAIAAYHDPADSKLKSKMSSVSKGSLAIGAAGVGATAAVAAPRPGSIATGSLVAATALYSAYISSTSNPMIFDIDSKLRRLEQKLSYLSLVDHEALKEIENELTQIKTTIDNISSRGPGYWIGSEARSKRLLTQAHLNNIDRFKHLNKKLRAPIDEKAITDLISEERDPSKKSQMLSLILDKLSTEMREDLSQSFINAIKAVDSEICCIQDENGNALLHFLVHNNKFDLLEQIHNDPAMTERFGTIGVANYISGSWKGISAKFRNSYNMENKEGLTPIMLAVFTSTADNLESNKKIIDLLSHKTVMDLKAQEKECYLKMAEQVASEDIESAFSTYNNYIKSNSGMFTTASLNGFNSQYWESMMRKGASEEINPRL